MKFLPPPYRIPLLVIFYLFTGLSPFAFRLSPHSFRLEAQTVPTGTPLLEDFYRRQQLTGNVDASGSFCIHPLYPVKAYKTGNPFDPDSSLLRQRKEPLEGIVRFDKNRGVIQLLPVTTQFQYMSHHPWSQNDGSMIPAKGFQMTTSAGIFMKYGPLSVQFYPDFVYARNDSFPGFPEAHSDAAWVAYYTQSRYIDLPERFGNAPWQKPSWGQSSVRLTAGPVSLGVSNENLWWGPGLRNSLLMTNTAPGFYHGTLNTVKPIKTWIGNFEFQLVAGRLDSSGFGPPVLERNGLGAKYIKAKPNDWVWFNGLTLNYNPKWVPGLFLGATRSFITYRKDMGTQMNDYLPVIIPVIKSSLGEEEENDKKRDQLASLYARWVWFKAYAEIYFEYGREDHAWDLRDIFLQIEHSRGYTVGLRKLIPVTKTKNQFIEVGLEFTDLENTKKLGNRSPGTWYVHGQVVQGYTHKGQLLGAAIGPGSNMQTLSVSWVQNLKKIGIQVERYTHNNEFQYNVIKDIRSNWVDLATSLIGEWDFRNLLLRAQIDGIVSFNYQHLFVPLDPNTTDFWTPAKNVWNWVGRIALVYRF